MPASRTEKLPERKSPFDSLITIAAVGDIMMGSDFPNASTLPPDDGAGMFSLVAPVLTSADVTFGNLEGPLLDGGTTTKCLKDTANCYAFRTPARYAVYLKNAGFDILSMANNHALDFGEAGRASTKHALDSVCIKYSGRVGDIARMTIRGKNIALIAFSYDDDSYNLNRLDRARDAVSKLVKENEIVLVSFHGGAEGAKYQHVPDSMEIFLRERRGHLRKFAHAMIDAGAAAVIGHGPHVVRGMEVYKDRLIAYSLGNFATYSRFNLAGPNGLACILLFSIDASGRFVSGQIVPTMQIKPGGPKPDPEKRIIPILRQLSQEDFGPGAVSLTSEGLLTPPSVSK
jgi:poly-gamma-glutamate capsule biosynthesis protein CapA/YwtB (metallophosphatase superfamily)